MNNERVQQQSLQALHDAAALLHAARGLVNMLEDLVDSGIRDTHRVGVSQAVIAEAVSLTPGRVSQVIGAAPALEGWSDRVALIRDWPREALEVQKSHFKGAMTYPPYKRRRVGLPQESEGPA
ncbi:hypothetical protein [Arthrobacter woluwensis]|uniref:Uncharacterized protein n=1 Tax=Arthrobacter woluwensis TaxID=156980 RepID=A0A1H4I714_9MICC|nr:hypothetical protein [Arthrobacter woluwensis]SEB29867.1 hypothetical protein SAMN04489745_0088 [Arthrobacter woluwensis]